MSDKEKDFFTDLFSQDNNDIADSVEQTAEIEIDESEEKESTEERKSKHRLLKIILAIIIIIIIILLLLRSCGSSNGGIDNIEGTGPSIRTEYIEATHPPKPVAPDIDENAGEWQVDPAQSGLSNVQIHAWKELTIPPNTKDNVLLGFYNPDENKDKFYLTFELRLMDDSEQGYEVLYTSGLVEPGLYIQNANLNRGLSIGEYNAILHIQPFTIADKSPTNNVQVNMKLIVK